MDFNFDIIAACGLTQGEFAQLTGASRGTVSNWVHGKSRPTAAYRLHVQKLLKVLTVAHDKGKLPGGIPTVYKGNMSSRRKYIRDTLKRTVSDIKRGVD